MNKNKKIAMAVVATVMAGTMAIPLAACNPTKTPSRGKSDQPKLEVADSYASGQGVTLSIGYNDAVTSIVYNDTNISDHIKGNSIAGTQRAGEFKVAWKALQSKLGVTFTQNWYDADSASGKNIATLKTQNKYDTTNILSASGTTITSAGANGELLDISKYLDEVPNYKAFLEANPVVWASLLADADTDAMYMLPYFDGNDDIEKYVLMRKDFVETLLDGEALSTTTFKDQADAKNDSATKPAKTIVGTASSVTSFMGKTGHWEVDVTDPSVLTGTPTKGTNKAEVSNATATTKIKIDYDKALADAKASTAGSLGAILAGVTGVTAADISGQTSGNIVDIMNVAINKSQGAVTGGQLVQLLRRYIDVAYLTTADASFYAQSGLKRSDVFNGACAAWDADLYAALGRCFVTSGDVLGSAVKGTNLRYLVAGREYTTQRTTDVSSLAGELYGVRGLESRDTKYTYIAEDGSVKDARSNASTWEALSKIHDLALEGLFNTSENITNNKSSYNDGGNGIQSLSLHDYVQTQTSQNGFNKNDTAYNFAPIVTPVSNWDVNDDGTRETIMRFTESWRGVKDGGLCVNYNSVKDSPATLAAVLKFIDYCYSDEGQIAMTFGPESTTGNSTTPDGTWYGTKLGTVNDNGSITWTGTPLNSDASKVIGTYDGGFTYYVKPEYKAQAFVFNKTIYSGTYYKGKMVPTMTDESYNLFGENGNNFTNYGRRVLGTTFCFNKDQGFEYQCTAECGKVGAAIVNIAITNGTIKHQYQTLNGTNSNGQAIAKISGSGNSMWYTLVPTLFPFSKAATDAMEGDLALVSGYGEDTNNLYVNTSKTKHNILLDVMYYGFDSSISVGYVTSQTISFPTSVQGCIDLNNANGLATFVTYKGNAWKSTLDWYSEL